MQEQYRPPISAQIIGLPQGAENNAPLKAKGYFQPIPHHRRLFVQFSPALSFHDLAHCSGAVCSLLFRFGSDQLWRTLDGGMV